MFNFSIRRYLSLALVLALVLIASFGGSDQASAAGEAGLSAAIAAQEAHTDRLMAIDGVIGTAVGAGNGGGHVVLALTTTGGVRGLPGAVGGVIVRPFVTGEIVAQPKPGSGGVDRAARFDPIPIGVSVGHWDITAGTIGASVLRGGTQYLLSNNHVLADANAGSVGDNILQPGAADGGLNPGDLMGTLFDSVPIDFFGGDNVVDAAIATVGGRTLLNSTPSGEGYGVASSTTIAATIGMNVTKFGLTTGSTNGKVDAINATVNVSYGDAGVARFVDQIIIKGKKGSFSKAGDSGSLIVAPGDNNPVALLFAGSNSITIGNPISEVLSALSIAIDGPADNTPPNNPPVVSISLPVDDTGSHDLNDGPNAITLEGTATDGDDDLSSSISWRSNIDGNLGTGALVTGVNLTRGVHTITASATDSGGATGSDSVTYTVVHTGLPKMAVSGFSFEQASRGPHDDLLFTVTIMTVEDVPQPVAGASITATLYRTEPTSRNFPISGTTGAGGSYTGKLRSAIDNVEYFFRVDDVFHASYTFDPTGNEDSCTINDTCNN